MDIPMPDASSPQTNLTGPPQNSPTIFNNDPLHFFPLPRGDVPATTFHPFLLLPKELQIQIYALAIANIPQIPGLPSRRLYISLPPQWATVVPTLAFLSMRSPRHGRRVVALPTDPLVGLWGLMETCMLAREVAVTWWREEVDQRMQEIGEREEELCSKKRLLEVLDEFIDAFKSRHRRIGDTPSLPLIAGG